ncbi:MAG: hypothetical protein R3F62_10110 [Planctomycetota bacterium]
MRWHLWLLTAAFVVGGAGFSSAQDELDDLLDDPIEQGTPQQGPPQQGPPQQGLPQQQGPADDEIDALTEEPRGAEQQVAIPEDPKIQRELDDAASELGVDAENVVEELDGFDSLPPEHQERAVESARRDADRASQEVRRLAEEQGVSLPGLTGNIDVVGDAMSDKPYDHPPTIGDPVREREYIAHRQFGDEPPLGDGEGHYSFWQRILTNLLKTVGTVAGSELKRTLAMARINELKARSDAMLLGRTDPNLRAYADERVRAAVRGSGLGSSRRLDDLFLSQNRGGQSGTLRPGTNTNAGSPVPRVTPTAPAVAGPSLTWKGPVPRLPTQPGLNGQPVPQVNMPLGVPAGQPLRALPR